MQALIIFGFALVCGISIYGFTLIEPGITVDEICPNDSYLRVSGMTAHEWNGGLAMLPASCFQAHSCLGRRLPVVSFSGNVIARLWSEVAHCHRGCCFPLAEMIVRSCGHAPGLPRGGPSLGRTPSGVLSRTRFAGGTPGGQALVSG